MRGAGRSSVPDRGRGQKERLSRGWSGSHSGALRGYRGDLAVDTDTGQIITFVLLRGNTRDYQVTGRSLAGARAPPGRCLAGVVADCGFTSHPAVAALLAARIPLILGFARSAPLRACLATLTGATPRAVGGRRHPLGYCHWDPRLQLLALAAREPTDHRGPGRT